MTFVTRRPYPRSVISTIPMDDAKPRKVAKPEPTPEPAKKKPAKGRKK